MGGLDLDSPNQIQLDRQRTVLFLGVCPLNVIRYDLKNESN